MKYWLIPIIIVALAIMVPLLPVFNIKTIQVETEYRETAVELAKASGLNVGANIFLTLLGKGNIFAMRFTEAEQKIASEFNGFGNVRIRAQLPSTVLIEYIAKEPVFEIEYGASCLITDINGCVLGSSREHELGYVRITGIDIEGFSIGCIVGENEEKFKSASEIYTELEFYDKTNLTAFREYIDWIDLSNPSGIAMMYDGRILVKFDPWEDLSYQTAAMCVILSQQIGFTEKGTLDFTSGDNPVFSAD